MPTRDMTRAQYERAVREEGFEFSGLGYLRDPETGSNFPPILVWDGKQAQSRRRETLANAMRRRDAVRAERRAANVEAP
jgi:hypothetical protein